MTGDDTDGFLGGRLRLRQGRGHRAGMDAVLLAEQTPPDQTGLVLDIGAGAGAVGLMAAVLAPAASVGLVEIDPANCALARENVARNGL
jgi:tRNA1(Val) A37 N6-methylase TrmN6